jgi:3-oxoadipate enol-lactonase
MQLSTAKFKVINGANICYDDFGEGETPIIFIHGFPFDKSSWQTQLDFLRKTNRVIAYDIRGFGNSTGGQDKISIQLFANDLIKFMDTLAIKTAIVCGLSMGGYILLNAVHQYPERFKAIILSDTQCLADSAEAKDKRMQTIAKIETDGLQNFADGFIKNIFCKESIENKKGLVASIKNIMLNTPPQTITDTLMALAQRAETCSALKQITVPALLLCGSEDKITPPEQAEFMHSNISDSTFYIINNAGHMANMEQPDVFNKHVVEFIAKPETIKADFSSL